jgi:hypothetical protein
MHSCSYPNAAFAHRTYQLSSLLWRCCYDGEERLVDSMDELLRFDAGFAEAAESFARYPA